MLLVSHALAYPPLTEEQRGRLETAYDGHDHQEDAFFALLENVSEMTGQRNDEPIRLHPDPEAMIENPQAYRGDLCRLEGVIQQQTTLQSPHEQVRECFIRDHQGRPLLVYLALLPARETSGLPFRDGDRIELDARFYKRVEFVARDGVRRSYAAFVGAAPLRVAPTRGDSLEDFWAVVIPVGVMLVVFVFLFILVRRKRSGGTPHRGRRHDEHLRVDETEPLPDDPAEALTELRQRANQDESA